MWHIFLGITFLSYFFLGDDRPISGASMNPARSLGPAIVSNEYRGIWVYMLGPTAGAISGAWVYNIIRFTDKPLREITKSASFLRYASSRNGSKRWPFQLYSYFVHLYLCLLCHSIWFSLYKYFAWRVYLKKENDIIRY